MQERSTFISNILAALPGYNFIKEMYYFFKNPEMLDGEWESAPLNKSGANLVASLLLVGTLTGVLSWLLKDNTSIDFNKVINPVYLTLILSLRAIIFGAIFWILSFLLTYLKKKSLHTVYFMQVIQTYSLLNFFIVLGLWFSINKEIKTSVNEQSMGFLDSLITLCFAFTIFYLSYRLLFKPSYRYLSKYYPKPLALFFMVCIIFSSIILNKYINLGIGNKILNKNETCQEVQKYKKQGLMNKSTENQYINRCLALL